MKSIDQIISELRHMEVGIRCRKCGAVPMLVGKQYSLRCPTCGTWITVTRNFLARLKEKEARARYGNERPAYRCGICQDRGFVIVEQQINDYLTSFLYRCLCSNGQKLDNLAGVPVLPPRLAERGAAKQGVNLWNNSWR